LEHRYILFAGDMKSFEERKLRNFFLFIEIKTKFVIIDNLKILKEPFTIA
jgi:hypothetical protein